MPSTSRARRAAFTVLLNTPDPWTRTKDAPEALKPLLETALVTDACQNSERLSDRMRGLGEVVDRLLDATREADRADQQRQDKPDWWAGALLLRRTSYLSADDERLLRERGVLRRAETLAALASASQQDRLRKAIVAKWTKKNGEPLDPEYFRTHHQRAVLDRLRDRFERMEAGFLRARNPGWSPELELYHAVQPQHLDDAFWWRPGTRAYIAQLADETSLTIFAGADGASDVGEPYHSLVGQLLLASAYSDFPGIAAPGLPDALEQAVIDQAIARVVAQLDGLSPTHIGSIVRGLRAIAGQAAGHLDEADTEIAIHGVVNGVIFPGTRDSRRTSNFVSRSIAELAISLKKEGATAVIVSAHYDDDLPNEIRELCNSEPDIKRLSDCRYSAIEELAVPAVIMLHRDPQTIPERRLMLSELDLFREVVKTTTEDLAPATWFDELSHLLSSSAALFVGTDIRSPALIAALAGTIGTDHKRYAVVVEDPWRLSESDERAHAADPLELSIGELPDEATAEAATAESEKITRSLYRNALAARYLHLRVLPIIVDYPYQVPQLLREVRLCATQGPDDYETYADRCDRWWRDNAASLGQGQSPDSRSTSGTTQDAVSSVLAKLRSDAEAQAGTDERVRVELWIRDPTSRNLFLWAASDGFWFPSSAAPTASLKIAGGSVQEAFREGRLVSGNIRQAAWRYYVAAPIALTDPEWHHIQVAVLQVLSTRPEKRSARSTPPRFTNVIEAGVSDCREVIPRRATPS
jgi:hypothetical protein